MIFRFVVSTTQHNTSTSQGNALDPLAQLAKEGLGEEGAAAAAAEAMSAREGVYVVAARPEERFKIAADLMRRRDKEDRARLKQLKKVRGAAGLQACGVRAAAGLGVKGWFWRERRKSVGCRVVHAHQAAP